MTQTFRNFSNGCASCRIEWRKGRCSRAFPAFAFALSVMSIGLSGLDWPLKTIGCVLTALEAWRAHQAARTHGAGTLVVESNAQGVCYRVCGARVSDFVACQRNAWWVWTWRDRAGRKRSLFLWPGDIAPAAVRELRQKRDAPVDAAHTHLLSP